MSRYDWVVDHLNTHWSLEACRLINLVGDQPHVERALAHLMEALASPLVDVITVG